jgi:F420-0:gamma-glutamyl ligase
MGKTKVEIAINTRDIAAIATTIVAFCRGRILCMTELQGASLDNTAFLDALIEYLEQ